MMDYIDGLLNIEPALHPWCKSCVVMVYNYMCILRNFASVFIRNIVLGFSFYILSLSGFVIRVMLAS